MSEMHHGNNTSQAAWIAIGSLCSFLFTLVSSAVLSRYLMKDAYGTYKQVMYVYHTLLSVFTLGLPLAFSYFLPRVSLAEGKTLIGKLNFAFIILGCIFSLTLYLCGDLIAEILKNVELSDNIRIFSPAPIFILPTMGLQGILATYKKTKLNAAYVVISRIFMLICVVLPVYIIKATVEVALWGFVISSLISMIAAYYFMYYPFRNVKKEKTNISYKQIFEYSLPLMVAGMFGIVIHAADQFYVSRYFGQRVFADFANGSLELPFVGMVLSACGTVLLPVFSQLIHERTSVSVIIDLWKRTALKAAYILYPLIVFCMFFATDIMTFLYGSRYADSGLYFQVMLIANFFTVIQFYPIILALGKTDEYAKVHMVVFVLVWTAEALSVWIINTAIAVTVVSVVLKIVKIILMMRIVSSSIGVGFWKLFPAFHLLKICSCCLVAGAITSFIVQNLPCTNYQILTLSIGFILFSIIIYLFGRCVKLDFLWAIRPILNKYVRI